jgi:hypothetical protein
LTLQLIRPLPSSQTNSIFLHVFAFPLTLSLLFLRLAKENLIPKLVAKLAPEYELSTDVHMNAARALVDAVVKCPCTQHNALIAHLQSTEVFQTILQHMFSGCMSSLTNSMSIIIVLVQRYANRRVELAIEAAQEKPEILSAEEQPKEEPFLSLMPHLHKIIQLLNQPHAPVKVQFGRAEPFGETRMKVVELTLVLLRSRLASVNEALADLDVLSLLLEAFFRYPWNNMLHGLVESIIRTVLDSDSKVLMAALFDKAQLVQKFIAAYDAGDEQNEINNNIDANKLERSTKANPSKLQNNSVTTSKQIYRAGYMGYLLRTSWAIEEFCRLSEEQRVAVLGSEENISAWNSFVSTKLERENDKQKICVPLVGENNDDMDIPFDVQQMAGSIEAYLGRQSGGEKGANESSDPYSFNGEDEELSASNAHNSNHYTYESEENNTSWGQHNQQFNTEWADFSSAFPSNSTGENAGGSEYDRGSSAAQHAAARELLQFPVGGEEEESEENEEELVDLDSQQANAAASAGNQAESNEEDFAVEFPPNSPNKS